MGYNDPNGRKHKIRFIAANLLIGSGGLLLSLLGTPPASNTSSGCVAVVGIISMERQQNRRDTLRRYGRLMVLLLILLVLLVLLRLQLALLIEWQI